MEIGTHRFYETDPNGKERLVAQVKFAQVWHEEKNVWRLARVLSYDHG